MQVGDDEEPCLHPFTDGFSQTVYEHQEAGSGGNGYQIVMERDDDDVRVDEHGNQTVRFQTARRVHEHHVYARIVVELFHQ